ncbi:thioesterase [Thermosipho melanesiensis]|uniref:Thioesterase n=2 Tax=Thermosipho melanesiensis TaxID=46541 RepID=A0ABM6GCL4_9BACT|nr:thioesterase [Thermosipho melanesiensis]APT73276.1 thioesterase [Thermosipho melanesiensis]OOC38669.1 thioesterase [Thermosipho melanesiensis]OOC40473.1 thioesterase [Thermosipho melanesiensis]OOC40738.1 thioesterase [Thermosipho melanesiensis]OOC44584.1 thioesterase [Thermosipho melanesiensis]
MWREIVGMSKTVEFVPDDSYIWDEDDEMRNYHFVSTSGLVKQFVSLGSKLLDDVLPQDLISVVVDVKIKQNLPALVGDRLVIGVRVTKIEENYVYFSGIATKENVKMAEIEFTRVVISRNYLRRKAVEKAT